LSISSAKLVIEIEIDGGQHFEAAHEARDARRDAFLASKGFRVMRFDNHQVMTNREGVLTALAEALAHPLPDPPPQAGEGDETPRSFDS
jgi:very-short-patch-repair endonuclease